jgi:hypothetical protein
MYIEKYRFTSKDTPSLLLPIHPRHTIYARYHDTHLDEPQQEPLLIRNTSGSAFGNGCGNIFFAVSAARLGGQLHFSERIIFVLQTLN